MRKHFLASRDARRPQAFAHLSHDKYVSRVRYSSGILDAVLASTNVALLRARRREKEPGAGQNGAGAEVSFCVPANSLGFVQQPPRAKLRSFASLILNYLSHGDFY